MNVALTGRLTVALRPEQAFQLFTPRGEQRWAAGWRPRFPAAATDDSAPGTVFETEAHGRTTTWVVAERAPGRRIRYTRVVPGINAGTVTVELSGGAGDHSDVTVTYELTALTDGATQQLADFAAGYPGMLREWAGAIATALTEPGRSHAGEGHPEDDRGGGQQAAERSPRDQQRRTGPQPQAEQQVAARGADQRQNGQVGDERETEAE